MTGVHVSRAEIALGVVVVVVKAAALVYLTATERLWRVSL